MSHIEFLGNRRGWRVIDDTGAIIGDNIRTASKLKKVLNFYGLPVPSYLQ